MNESTPKRVKRILGLAFLSLLLVAGVALWAVGNKRVTLPTLQPGKPLTPGYYKVTEFYDGDTIAVDMDGSSEKVRLIGVDTPETQDPRKPVQCFGKAASDYTRNLIGERRVRLEADPTNTNRDRYDRLLRYVYLEDGTLVNEQIIREGYGFAYTAFPFQKVESFTAAQAEAEQAGRGLWSSCRIEGDDVFLQTNAAP